MLQLDWIAEEARDPVVASVELAECFKADGAKLSVLHRVLDMGLGLQTERPNIGLCIHPDLWDAGTKTPEEGSLVSETAPAMTLRVHTTSRDLQEMVSSLTGR